MRRILLIVALSASVFAQSPAQTEGPDFSRAARPRGSFYLNGVGHQYLQGNDFTVIAAALPVLNSKFFGVKVHIINRGKQSITVLPGDITADDSVGAKQMALFTAVEVNDKVQRPTGLARAAGVLAGPTTGIPGADNAMPTMTDLLRELVKEATAESPWAADAAPMLTPRGAARVTAASSPACDLGCELRNREIGDGSGPQLPRRLVKPEVLEQAEFLANTIPPQGDVEGVLYFAMPKLTDKAPISHTGRKSYLVTVTVPVGDEKFQFVFPPE